MLFGFCQWICCNCSDSLWIVSRIGKRTKLGVDQAMELSELGGFGKMNNLNEEVEVLGSNAVMASHFNIF